MPVTAPTLPGFVWDPVRGRYFAAAGSHEAAAGQHAYSRQGLQLAQSRRRLQARLRGARNRGQRHARPHRPQHVQRRWPVCKRTYPQTLVDALQARALGSFTSRRLREWLDHRLSAWDGGLQRGEVDPGLCGTGMPPLPTQGMEGFSWRHVASTSLRSNAYALARVFVTPHETTAADAETMLRTATQQTVVEVMGHELPGLRVGYAELRKNAHVPHGILSAYVPAVEGRCTSIDTFTWKGTVFCLLGLHRGLLLWAVVRDRDTGVCKPIPVARIALAGVSSWIHIADTYVLAARGRVAECYDLREAADRVCGHDVSSQAILAPQLVATLHLGEGFLQRMCPLGDNSVVLLDARDQFTVVALHTTTTGQVALCRKRDSMGRFLLGGRLPRKLAMRGSRIERARTCAQWGGGVVLVQYGADVFVLWALQTGGMLPLPECMGPQSLQHAGIGEIRDFGFCSSASIPRREPAAVHAPFSIWICGDGGLYTMSPCLTV